MRAVGSHPRVLDVGCGDGEVARQLAALGCQVTALDLRLRDTAPATNVTFVERDFLEFEAATPFDVLVFTASLHHIAPLDQAIRHAATLLMPGGRMIVDDFDLAAPDVETLTWYYELQELLAVAGVYRQDHLDAPAPDVKARWQAAHHHEPALHSGAVMRSELSTRFVIRELQRCEYLYRYIAAGLPRDDQGQKLAAHIRRVERTKIVAGSVVPVGLRIVAVRPESV